jgi:hypothetical protein
MELIVSIPDKAAVILSAQNGDLARTVLEGYALEGYRSGKLMLSQVQELLGFETSLEAEAFLQRHNVSLAGAPANAATFGQAASQDSLLVAVQRKLLEISQSESDWDSYGAQPTSLNAVRKAEELFTQIAKEFYAAKGEQIRPYDVAPLTNGGVQLEWRGLHSALEVEVHADAGFRYLLVQGQGEHQQFQESEGASAEEIARLVLGVIE